MNKRMFLRLLKTGLFTGDAVIIAAAAVLSYYIRFYIHFIPVKYGIPVATEYLYAIPVILVVFLLAFNYSGLYRLEHGRSRFDELVSVLTASSASIIILVSITFFFRHVSYSRVVIMHMWLISVIMLAIWRFTYRSIFNSVSHSGAIIQKILIVGATDISKILIDRLARQHDTGYKVIGVIDNKLKKNSKFCGLTILGKIKDFNNIAGKYNMDEAFIGLSDYNRKEVADLILENENIKFMIASDVLGIITKSIDYDEMFGIPVFEVRELPLNITFNRMVKRVFDLVVSLVIILVLSPILVLTAILVKFSSKGPVFYAQERVSRDNKKFLMLKFRTMKVDAENKSGPVWAKENDPRRTAIGTFLRKTSIDELPQFLNVIKGDISIVGPRPERPHFIEKFKKEIPRYTERHKVKGGISGWAQVNGLRGDTSLSERIKYDLYYIENWTLWFDVKIIIKTALEIFHHKTAY
ncbi:MAG: undecaprenyl-phosphate glucose phosphotransferase [bacterium]